MNPDRLAELEDERRFLLRSLRDLDAELAAGDVDEHDYETLRDGYTKRAADVLREIEEGQAALPARPPTPLVEAAGDRRCGVAGRRSAPDGWSPARPASASAARRSPAAGESDDVAVVLAQARALLGVDPVRAQELYAQVLEERPDHAEALAYSGFLLFDASAGASAELRPDSAVGDAPSTARPGRSRPTRSTPTRTASWR